jgi:hypothetical protein
VLVQRHLAAAYGVSSARHQKLARVVTNTADDAAKPAAEPGTQQARDEELAAAAAAAASAAG